MGRKQAVGWLLIALSGVMSVGIFASEVIERSEVPVTSPDETPVIERVPLDGE